MQTIHVTPENQLEVVRLALTVLRDGGLVLFPTETTYGAGVDACNQQAVEKLLAYKSRREGKPLSIAVTDLEMAQRYVTVNEQAETLYRQFLPGPVTVVSRGLGVVAPGVESEFGTLGVRIPEYQLVTEIVKALGRPITATSANGSGEKRPYSIEDVLTRLSGKQLALIDLVIDAGQLPTRPPSTVIDTTLATPITLRQGEINLSGQTNSDGGADTTLELISLSEAETKHIAGTLLLKHWDAIQQGPIIVALDGPLGAGKTVFAKGVADFLSITTPIASPTYTYIEEYDFTRHHTTGKFFHADMWKVDSLEQFERLECEALLKSNTVIVIEWWSQVAAYVAPLLEGRKHVLIRCGITDVNEKLVRSITVTQQAT